MLDAYQHVGPRLTMLVMSFAPVLGAVLAWLFLGQTLPPNALLRPARLRLELLDPESPALVFLAWDGEREAFVRVTLPPVGASVRLGAPAAAVDEGQPRGT
jgi:hypothetical protein